MLLSLLLLRFKKEGFRVEGFSASRIDRFGPGLRVWLVAAGAVVAAAAVVTCKSAIECKSRRQGRAKPLQ